MATGYAYDEVYLEPAIHYYDAAIYPRWTDRPTNIRFTGDSFKASNSLKEEIEEWLAL